MDIKNKPTLAEKQAFWTEQLPNFESKYWLPSHFELLEFDMEGGNYEVRDVLPEHYSEDDATEIWHRVNTGWAMWKKAINFTKAQVPESNALLSAAVDAVKKLGSGDFVLVPKEPSADLVNHGHQVFLGHFNEGGQTGGRSLYFAYKAMIEAQEQSHD